VGAEQLKASRLSNTLDSIVPSVALACLTVLTLPGCKRQPPVPPAPSQSSSAGVSVDALAAAGATAPPPPSTPGDSTAPDVPANEPAGQISIEDLNKALRLYFQVDPNLPDDLAVLYRAKMIPSVPIPPPGKKYVVDKKKVEVKLVSQ
jgi:hypothetical protein